VFPPNPIPVTVEGLGDAWVIYIKSNGQFEDDEVTVCLMDGGQWRHVTTSKIKSWHNETYGIIKSKTKKGVDSVAKNKRGLFRKRQK
jgi:hypothetical protein